MNIWSRRSVFASQRFRFVGVWLRYLDACRHTHVCDCIWDMAVLHHLTYTLTHSGRMIEAKGFRMFDERMCAWAWFAFGTHLVAHTQSDRLNDSRVWFHRIWFWNDSFCRSSERRQRTTTTTTLGIRLRLAEKVMIALLQAGYRIDILARRTSSMLCKNVMMIGVIWWSTHFSKVWGGWVRINIHRIYAFAFVCKNIDDKIRKN